MNLTSSISFKSFILQGPSYFGKETNNTWDEMVCPRCPTSPTFMELDECKSYCWRRKGCTAIAYREKPKQKGNCVLFKCPLPVPDPKIRNRHYNGYAIRAGITE